MSDKYIVLTKHNGHLYSTGRLCKQYPQRFQTNRPTPIKDVVQLTDKVSMKLKYPEFSLVTKLKEKESAVDIAFEIIADSIEYVYDGEQFYYASDAQPGEFLELVENLNNEQFKKIENFISNLPTLKHTMNITCSKCGYQHKINGVPLAVLHLVLLVLTQNMETLMEAAPNAHSNNSITP